MITVHFDAKYTSSYLDTGQYFGTILGSKNIQDYILYVALLVSAFVLADRHCSVYTQTFQFPPQDYPPFIALAMVADLSFPSKQGRRGHSVTSW